MPELSSFSIKKAYPIMILGLRHWKPQGFSFCIQRYNSVSNN